MNRKAMLLGLCIMMFGSVAEAQITLGPIAIGDTFTDTNVAAGGTCVASGTGTTPNTTCTYGGLWQVHKSILNAIVSQLCTCFPGNIGPTGATGSAGTNGTNGTNGAAGLNGKSLVVKDITGTTVPNVFISYEGGGAGTYLFDQGAWWLVDATTGQIQYNFGYDYYDNSSCSGQTYLNYLLSNKASTSTAGGTTWRKQGVFPTTQPSACWKAYAGLCVADDCSGFLLVKGVTVTKPSDVTGVTFPLQVAY